jgi:hypothetical protein
VSYGEEVAMAAEEADVGQFLEDDEAELALARLEWAKDAHCLDIPDQARAVEWHAAACAEAQDALAADGGTQG